MPQSLFEPALVLEPARRSAGRTACFAVSATADPGTVPRVLAPFAKRGLIPSRLHAVHDQDGLLIDLQVTAMGRQTAEAIANGLRQIFGVRTVLVAMKS